MSLSCAYIGSVLSSALIQTRNIFLPDIPGYMVRFLGISEVAVSSLRSQARFKTGCAHAAYPHLHDKEIP